MARQVGTFKIDGTIGDLTFYRSGGDYLIRSKGGVDGDRIKNDPNFQRTRENGSEFGEAAVQGKLIRQAFRTLVDKVADSRVTSRLTSLLVKVVQSDTTNERGSRKVKDGNLALLKDFEFNKKLSFSSTVLAAISSSVDKSSGSSSASFTIIPKNDVVYPNGATHYKVSLAAGLIDFDGAIYEVDVAESEISPIDSNSQEITLSNEYTGGTERPLFLLLAIEFYQAVNESMYPMNSRAMKVLGVDVSAPAIVET